ncbi:MAG: LysR family transcriptional regulator [Clostridia bacterium]|nr:LysR family transcriptional regulator [Clostridia bacterium]
MDINFELYRFFYFAAKHENFSDAAEKLFVSQSAVSQSVKKLEDKMGVQLFFRKTRNLKLTPEGTLLFKHIEQAYNFIKTAENKIFEMQSLDSGEVRIGVGDTICKYYLIPYIQRFYHVYPNIKIQVINRTSSQILEILKNGLIDFGITTLPMHDKNFEVEDFITVKDIFVASNNFSELKGKKVTLSELGSYPLLMLEKKSATRQIIDSFFRQSGIEITPEVELGSIDLLVEFAKIGLGISHVLKESAEDAIMKNDLFEVETIEKLPERKLGIITMRNVPASRASMEFIKCIKPLVYNS